MVQYASANLNSLKDDWDNKKDESEQALSNAQAAYDEAGYDFLNSKINELGSFFYTLDEMIEICVAANAGGVESTR